MWENSVGELSRRKRQHELDGLGLVVDDRRERAVARGGDGGILLVAVQRGGHARPPSLSLGEARHLRDGDGGKHAEHRNGRVPTPVPHSSPSL